MMLLNIRRHASAFHIRSDHNARYDFPALLKLHPPLSKHVKYSPLTKEQTIDWSDGDAVLQFNKALLMRFYHVNGSYDVPEPYLVPPIPSRADYVHHLLSDIVRARGKEKILGLDIGTGANCVYPLISAARYPNVQIVGTDIDAKALKIAHANLQCSPLASACVSLRLQPKSHCIFHNIIQPGEYFDFSMCNPPFYSSEEQAQAQTDRKLSNLGLPGSSSRNFGGDKELFCEGGEQGFIRRMIDESFVYRSQLGWVTTLVSAKRNLAPLEKFLRLMSVKKTECVKMNTGQKSVHLLAWHF